VAISAALPLEAPSRQSFSALTTRPVTSVGGPMMPKRTRFLHNRAMSVHDKSARNK